MSRSTKAKSLCEHGEAPHCLCSDLVPPVSERREHDRQQLWFRGCSEHLTERGFGLRGNENVRVHSTSEDHWKTDVDLGVHSLPKGRKELTDAPNGILGQRGPERVRKCSDEPNEPLEVAAGLQRPWCKSREPTSVVDGLELLRPRGAGTQSGHQIIHPTIIGIRREWSQLLQAQVLGSIVFLSATRDTTPRGRRRGRGRHRRRQRLRRLTIHFFVRPSLWSGRRRHTPAAATRSTRRSKSTAGVRWTRCQTGAPCCV
mmetsp:Transcript_11209/g.31035  ORF Transcript_11209/g.31035 Transcript_11209/m.31035 type:complete len:258 (-) Transcript_11209:401-1174(-)